MNRLWLFLIAMGLTITLGNGCKSENTADSEVVEETVSDDSHAGHDHDGHDHSADANTGTAVKSDVSNMPWTFLTNGIFHNNATITIGQKMTSNPNEGHWIDFKDNGEYDYGIWDKKQYDGAYYYDNDTHILQLQPRADVKKSEWQVMHKDDNLILVGTGTYSDNATQMRFVRKTSYPQKK